MLDVQPHVATSKIRGKENFHCKKQCLLPQSGTFPSTDSTVIFKVIVDKK